MNPPRSPARHRNPLDLRHLIVFQQTYLTRDFTAAGHDLFTNRKGIIRHIQTLEDLFQSKLFVERERGVLDPSPLAERLHNDLRHLISAQSALRDQIHGIHQSGRLVKLGSSGILFRTPLFRKIFRALQTTESIRTSYIPVDFNGTFKTLLSGECDLLLSCAPSENNRISSVKIGEAAYRHYRQKDAQTSQETIHLVPADGVLPSAADVGSYRPIKPDRFLLLLDHPEQISSSTILFGPEVPLDTSYWISSPPQVPVSLPVYAHFLKLHPYEFLSALCHRLADDSPSS